VYEGLKSTAVRQHTPIYFITFDNAHVCEGLKSTAMRQHTSDPLSYSLFLALDEAHVCEGLER
jgi:hypothetical protein